MTKKLTIVLSLLVIVLMGSFLVMNFEEIKEGYNIIGKVLVSTQLVILNVFDNQCNTTFVSGWNLASFPCLNNNQMNITTFFNNVTYDSIRTFDASDTADPWKAYKPDLPSYVVFDLSTVSRIYGYYVYTDNTTQFIFNNSLATPTDISLVAGWNLIGYPRENISNVGETFNSIVPGFDYVLTFNASNPSNQWLEWTWNSSLTSNQDLNKTIPNEGYWIYMLTTGTLTIS